MPQSHHKNTLWEFIGHDGSFRVPSPEQVSRLYFPLANEGGILSSITPDLHGDIKTSHNSFLTLPVSIEDLHDSKSSRNFWLHIEGHGIWSATGVSATQNANRLLHTHQDKVSLEAGPLWHKVSRENKTLGIRAEITNFTPVSNETVEIMIVSLTNIGRSPLKLTATSAIPIFGRSADNLRDHAHVTSLLNRILSHPAGVVVKPTMSFDERGHKINDLHYCVVGTTGQGEFPIGSFSTIQDFIGEGGNLEAPEAILKNLPVPQKDGHAFQGKSAIGALRFKPFTLGAQEKMHFVLLLGIAEKDSLITDWLKKFGSFPKAEAALKENKTVWAKKLDTIQFQTQDPNYDRWLKWVCLQPTLRKIFGCSFLPDFDYGRGGRGWRDLWQDCLALLLTTSSDARALLLNNFNGIRIDGSNATIIGTGSGEFRADRNNITRVWMDHGVWPYLTLELYIHQTGDIDVLFQRAGYFRDKQLWRARKKDPLWQGEEGKCLTTRKGRPVDGTILEHILVQHLVQFFNVGEHNHIRLENADWNDGLDMAYEKGESVAFTALYASNLKKLADLLEEICRRKKIKRFELAKELLLLLDRATPKKVDYRRPKERVKRLEKYFDAVQPFISGVKSKVPAAKLIADLRAKSDFLTQHIRDTEWLALDADEGLYNGYYDNHGRRVEGHTAQGMRMTLAGQVFPVMGGVATHKQVQQIFASARKYLKDKDHGGFRLNTDFGQIRPDLGRAFSFAYGEKENGAFFSHMAVMFSNALYQRGFVKEGHEVLESIYRMCVRTDKSRIFPGIPEYFNSEGRGLYHYLTGSASWLVLTVLTQAFGFRGKFGDLLLAPKFTAEEFSRQTDLTVRAQFAGKPVQVIFRNPKKIGYEFYTVKKVVLDGKELKDIEPNKQEALIPRGLIANSHKSSHQIIVTLE